MQRCGSALNANPHFHTLVAEGVFAEPPDGSQRFVPLREPPSDVEVARLLAAVRGRIIRLLRRHDIDLEGKLESTPDGKVLLRLRRPWRDGMQAIRFEPSEFLEKLAVVIPRPRINLLLYHGAFAPRGCCHRGPVVVENAPRRAAALFRLG